MSTIIDAWDRLNATDKEALIKVMQVEGGYANLSIASLALVSTKNAMDHLQKVFHHKQYWSRYGQKDIIYIDGKDLHVNGARLWLIHQILAQSIR